MSDHKKICSYYLRTENEMQEPELVKKLHKESLTEAKDCTKLTTQDEQMESLNKKQEHILQDIENENIQKFIEEQISKFNPPYCQNCPKRRADRVCVNKNCGRKYMQLICGKCHCDAHKDAATKHEIDIAEYFTKLAKFLSTQQYQKKQSKSIVDTDNLAQLFPVIQEIKEKLNYLKNNLINAIKIHQSPSEMHTNLQDSISGFLTQSKIENFQEQLDNIKKTILFQANKFSWNDGYKTLEIFSQTIKQLESFTTSMNQTIAQSFLQYKVDLSKIQYFHSTDLCREKSILINQLIKPGNEGITLATCNAINQSQVFLGYSFDTAKKYRLRFRFDIKPMEFIMIGVMPISKVSTDWVCNIQDQYFVKRFMSNLPAQECSRVTRGRDLSVISEQNMQIEMRIDFEENYVDFSDFPEQKNINTSHLDNKFSIQGPYVLALAFYNTNQITIEQLDEIPCVDQY